MVKICQYFKPISISLSPNTESDDIWLALKIILRPWMWKSFGVFRRNVRPGLAINVEKTLNNTLNYVEQLEEEFKRYLGVKYAFAFNSGRSGLLAILKSLGIEQGGEILLQAFTCNAAVNPVLWAGLKPVYIDCQEDDFNIDIDDLKRKITPKSRVLMVQHTFGLPADMDKILEVVKQNNLILIEDCAHSLGADYRGRKVGTFGRAAFFSFSRDKVISSVYGGVAVTNDDKLGAKLLEFQKSINYPSHFWILQQLLHPLLLNFIILPLYNFFDLGKIFLILSQIFHILSKAVHWKEKRGKKPSYFPRRMPNALALLALNQFRKLEKFNSHRKKIANFYYQELKNTDFELPRQFPERKNIFLRFTIKHPKALEIIYQAWHKKNILLGDWYTTPIAPFDTQLDKVKYKIGTCPKAEKLSKTTFNLPTHINISKKESEKVVNLLKLW